MGVDGFVVTLADEQVTFEVPPAPLIAIEPYACGKCVRPVEDDEHAGPPSEYDAPQSLFWQLASVKNRMPSIPSQLALSCEQPLHDPQDPFW